MNLLGISDIHNASAALLGEGIPRGALQDERRRRELDDSGVPAQGIEFMLQHSGPTAGLVDVIALAGKHQPPDRDRNEIHAESARLANLASRAKGGLRYRSWTIPPAITSSIRSMWPAPT